MAFQSEPAFSDSLMGRKCHLYGQLQSVDADSILNGSAQSMNVGCTRMFFSPLVYNQTQHDLVYKPTVEQDECLKKDSLFSTTMFHLESKFQKHNIK